MKILIDILVYAFFVYLSIGVLYIAVFAFASVFGRKRTYPPALPNTRFRVLYPAYKEDTVIVSSVASALQQDYPKHLYSVCVIADHMQDSTLDTLRQMGAEVLPLNLKNSSKAKALTLAMLHDAEEYPSGLPPYDRVVILDADNVVPPTFLQQINDYFAVTPHPALQTHRTAKNFNTPTAVLDAAIEEINNSIFRSGHVRLGISSSLIGSGMAIDYAWFAEHVGKAVTAGEDKELEEMMLRERMHIGYAPHIPVYDEKVQHPDAMRQQRRRWLASQLMLAKLMWPHMGKALASGNTDYALKAVESLVPPRSLFLLLLTLLALLATLSSPTFMIWAWILWLSLIISLYTAIPYELRNRQLWTAIRRIPSFILLMAGNLFHLRGASGKFIHTNHG